MKIRLLKNLFISITILLLNPLLIQVCIAQNTSLKNYESYYLKTDIFPENTTKDWCPNGRETQGVTNDSQNWYFTSTDYWDDNGFMLRIPVSIDLNQDVRSFSGVIEVSMSMIPALASKQYWHWGDPDHFKYHSVDYILVPVYGGTSKPAIALFKADNLTFINYTLLDSEQGNVGWCAINKEGDFYTSEHQADALYKYTVDWEKLISSDEHDALKLKEVHKLKDDKGSSLLLHNMQGGEFSSSGELLYIVSGSGECLGGGAGIFSTDGIHVFDTLTWKEVKRSINKNRNEIGYFDYSFDNGCIDCGFFLGGAGSATPEGLTVWDLDDGRAPNINGQLHVIINLFNKYALCDDEFSLHHFGNKIYVDKENGLPPIMAEPFAGSKERPINSFYNAYNWYPIWDGAEIVLKGDAYGEIGNFSKRIRITSENGLSIIGTKDTSNFSGVRLFDSTGYLGDSLFISFTNNFVQLNQLGFSNRLSSIDLINVKEVILYVADESGLTRKYEIYADSPILPNGISNLIYALEMIK